MYFVGVVVFDGTSVDSDRTDMCAFLCSVVCSCVLVVVFFGSVRWSYFFLCVIWKKPMFVRCVLLFCAMRFLTLYHLGLFWSVPCQMKNGELFIRMH